LTRPAAAGGYQLRRYVTLGFSIGLPRNWTPVPGTRPLLTARVSDRAVIALWRYPRTGPAPSTPAQLGQARQRLLAAARRRDPTLRLITSHTGSAAGFPAIELRTIQRIDQQVREVQSTHMFGRGEELVLEEYAPVSIFAGLDRSVFSAVTRSLTALGG
jgi:endonuclease/exonuclease/phosphatase (EEP) superfamily protein YafD